MSTAAAKVPVQGQWTSSIIDAFEDPVTCIIGYCLPCVLYGQNATTVNGGDCVSHGLKFYLYSCCCACGLVSGPTRRAIRDKYELPVAPAFLKDQGANADCLTGTIPCVACFALCQDARELAYRAPGAPIDPRDFDWAPVPAAPVAPAETAAPAQAEMAK